MYKRENVQVYERVFFSSAQVSARPVHVPQLQAGGLRQDDPTIAPANSDKYVKGNPKRIEKVHIYIYDGYTNTYKKDRTKG